MSSSSIATAAVCVVCIFIVVIAANAFWPDGRVSPQDSPEDIENAKRARREIFTATAIWSTALLSVIAVVVTHCDTRQIIRGSDEAASQQHADTLNTLTSAQRAFVSAFFFFYPELDLKNGTITRWCFQPRWVNSGNTPTRNMIAHTNMKTFKTIMPETWDFPDRWDERKTAAPLLGIAPKTDIFGQAICIHTDLLLEAFAAKRFIYLYGWTKYNDVFPGTANHVSRFNVTLAVGESVLDATKEGFSFNLAVNYNCSDEECDRIGYPATWQAADDITPIGGIP